VSLAGEENVSPPFRTPIPTVTDELLQHVEAHTGRVVRLCDGEEVLERGAALPENGVVVVAPTPHRTLAHIEALSDSDCVVVSDTVVMVDRHGCPLSFVIRNTRVTNVSMQWLQCVLTKVQWTHVRVLERKCGEFSACAPLPETGSAYFCHSGQALPDGAGVGDAVDLTFNVCVCVAFPYFRVVSIRKV
jgi:hypothetical protein